MIGHIIRGVRNTDLPPSTPFGLCRLIGQIRGEIVLGIERALREAGLELNFSQFLALKKVGETGGMAPGELARCLNYNPGALTRLLDKLEQLGYLRRVPDPADRRALQLELTDAGNTVYARILTASNTAADRVFADVDGADRQHLYATLVRVLQQMQVERDRTPAA